MASKLGSFKQDAAKALKGKAKEQAYKETPKKPKK
jgi:acyl-CoA-binding protein